MRTREEVQEEQRRAEARVQRWNESVDDVRQLQLEWQRDNEAQFGPFLHPVEDQESWRKFLTFRDFSGILLVLKVRDKQEMKKETIFQVTFTNHSTVFIKAMDEGHARRIVERNGTTWTRGDHKVEMIIDKIEEAKN